MIGIQHTCAFTESLRLLTSLPSDTVELYGLLMDRTEGEALERVQGGTEGDGIEAYGRLVLWYMHTTPLNLQKRCAASVTPMPVKKDEDLAAAIENEGAPGDRDTRPRGEDQRHVQEGRHNGYADRRCQEAH